MRFYYLIIILFTGLSAHAFHGAVQVGDSADLCDGPNRHFKSYYDSLWQGTRGRCWCGPEALSFRAGYLRGRCEKISATPLCFRVTSYDNADLNPNWHVDIWEKCLGESTERSLTEHQD